MVDFYSRDGFITINGKEEEIKSCPFCGQISRGIYATDLSKEDNPHLKALNKFVVYCSGCGALVYSNIAADHSAVEEAWRKWQTRH